MAANDGVITLKIVTSNATRAVLDALTPAFERESGHRLEIVHDSAKAMLARILSGEGADVAILLVPAVDELVSAGRIRAPSRRMFSHSKIGLGVLAGRPKPDLGSVDALKRTLLAAKSIAHTVNGASGMYFPTLAQRLGIAAEIAHKIVTRPGGLIGKVVVAGEAEIAFQQIAELLVVPGLEVAGPLPDAVQLTIDSAAGIFADTKHPDAAEALLRFLSSASSLPVFRAHGLEPAHA